MNLNVWLSFYFSLAAEKIEDSKKHRHAFSSQVCIHHYDDIYLLAVFCLSSDQLNSNATLAPTLTRV